MEPRLSIAMIAMLSVADSAAVLEFVLFIPI